MWGWDHLLSKGNGVLLVCYGFNRTRLIIITNSEIADLSVLNTKDETHTCKHIWRIIKLSYLLVFSWWFSELTWFVAIVFVCRRAIYNKFVADVAELSQDIDIVSAIAFVCRGKKITYLFFSISIVVFLFLTA